MLLVYSGESAYSAGGVVSSIVVLDLALERVLRKELGGNLLYSEHVDTTRLGDPGYVRDIRSLLHSKYALRKPDLIFVFGDVAVDFISKDRANFFLEIPVVFGAVDPSSRCPIPRASDSHQSSKGAGRRASGAPRHPARCHRRRHHGV